MRRIITCGGLSRRDFCALSLAAAAAGALPTTQAAETPVAKGASRKWTVFVLQNSHIDIGFTDKQEILADYEAQFVRQALQMARAPAQKERDAACRFKFTCEGFWQVEQFLATASPQERRELVRAMKEGTMELTACRFHLTELLDQEMLRRSVGRAAAFARQEGLPLVAAMACDINGFSWGMADALAEIGVRYLYTNINRHHSVYPFGKQLVPFYWESPSGKRILVWHGYMYNTANVLGLMGTWVPGGPDAQGLDRQSHNGVVEMAPDIGLAERTLLPHLAGLEQSGYPYDFLPLAGSGLHTDNSPPGQQYCEIIRKWNAMHGERVHVRTATLREFFEHLEKNVKKLPVYRGEWTDWWSDGAAASPLDTLIFRNAQRTRHVIDLLDTDQKIVPPDRRARIDDELMLYAEHTFGYSRTYPAALVTEQVFLRKGKHAVEADELAGAGLHKILRVRGEGPFTNHRPFAYEVLNPLPTPLHAAVYLPLNHWEKPTVEAGFRVVDDHGKVYPHQVESAPRGWTAALTVRLGPQEQRRFHLALPPPQGASPKASRGRSFENAFYRATWTEGMGLKSLIDLASGAEVLDPKSGTLGSPVYQLFPHGRRGAAGYGSQIRSRDQVTFGQCKAIHREASGPIYERWLFHYEVPGATEYVLAVTFFRDLPQIAMTVRLSKTDVRDPEGMYVLFPFALAGGTWHLDKPGAIIQPGRDQLPKTCCDYYSLQHGAALAGSDLGVAWSTLDAPLVQLGKLRLWTYSTSIEPTGPLFSWLCNNKWETNWRPTCGGAYEFRYVIQLDRDFSDFGKAIQQCQTLSYPPIVMRQ
jgi:hypothetical protein